MPQIENAARVGGIGPATEKLYPPDKEPSLLKQTAARNQLIRENIHNCRVHADEIESKLFGERDDDPNPGQCMPAVNHLHGESILHFETANSALTDLLNILVRINSQL